MDPTADPLGVETREARERVAPTLPGGRLRRVLQYIDEHLQSRIRLVELSAVVHMSPFHFARLFARSTGLPPHRFIVQRRIEAARALLAAERMSIAAIARSVGFRTPSHFTTTFRRVVGMTPRAYRVARAERRGPERTSDEPAIPAKPASG